MTTCRSAIGAGILALICVGVAGAAPLAPTAGGHANEVVLTPHKAFYNLKLARTSAPARVTRSVSGRFPSLPPAKGRTR
jgi:hypothetical protein